MGRPQFKVLTECKSLYSLIFQTGISQVNTGPVVMTHNLRLVKAARDLKETLHARNIVPGMQEQAVQVEFMSNARELYLLTHSLRVHAGEQALCCWQPQEHHPTCRYCNNHRDALVHEGKFVIFNRPRNILVFK